MPFAEAPRKHLRRKRPRRSPRKHGVGKFASSLREGFAEGPRKLAGGSFFFQLDLYTYFFNCSLGVPAALSVLPKCQFNLAISPPPRPPCHPQDDRPSSSTSCTALATVIAVHPSTCRVSSSLHSPTLHAAGPISGVAASDACLPQCCALAPKVSAAGICSPCSLACAVSS